MAKIRICKEQGCHNAQTTGGYCRLHYLRNWKKIKRRRRKTAAERLNKYIDNICSKHPDRYMEVIKKNIRSKSFEKQVNGEFGSELDDIYKIFNDPGYEEDVERLIKDLKVEKDF